MYIARRIYVRSFPTAPAPAASSLELKLCSLSVSGIFPARANRLRCLRLRNMASAVEKPKDATEAGGEQSDKCTLILTLEDSGNGFACGDTGSLDINILHFFFQL